MSRLIAAMRTQVDAPVRVTDPAEVDRRYRYWRVRVLVTTIVGYAFYYVVRTNIGLPLKAMGEDLHYSREKMGVILTFGSVTYGISKFLNGFLGDHANPRYFMSLGLLACVAMNVAFGMSASLALFVAFWALNNYAQGMGFPPCAKSMAHWFSPRERSTTFGIWHTSHMIGAALVSALTGYLVKYFGWRSCFYVPAALAAGGAVVVWMFLRDTPGSLGLPPVELYKGEETPTQLARELGEPVAPGDTLNYEPEPVAVELEAEDQMTYGQVVTRYILKNPFMWVISFANLFTYVLRDTQTKWGPTFLQEAKGISVVAAGWLNFGSEMGGMVAALLGGLIADRVFGGRAGRVCVIAMALMTAVIYAFMKTPAGHPVLAGVLFVIMGFLLYVPQMLIAAMAMNLGTKRASAAAVGLTGIIGYAGTVITGWGIGRLVDHDHNWNGAFKVLLCAAVVTLVLMATTWNVGAHAHRDGH